MLIHAQRRFALALVPVLVKRDREFPETVVQYDGGERVDVHRGHVRRLHDPDQLLAEPRRAEKGVIHVVAEVLRTGRLAIEHVQQVFLGEAVAPAHFFRDVVGEQLARGREAAAVQRLEAVARLLVQPRQGLHRAIGQEEAVFPAFLVVHLKVAEHLLEGQLKGIADIVEQRGQPPEFQEEVGDLVLLPVLQTVKVTEGKAVGLVRLVDRKAQREHVDRMGIVVPVLHQQRAAVGLVLGEQLHHLLGLSVLAEEDLQKRVVDHIGVLGDAGVDEGLQRFFQAETVDVPLHVVGDLTGLEALAQIDARQVFRFLFLRVEAKRLAAVVQKAERGGFQIVFLPPVGIEGRLRGTDVVPETRLVLLPHLFQSRISHDFSSCSPGRNESNKNHLK